MEQSKMFKQFNELYGVGDIEPTRENLEKALGLIVDEVKELYEELFYGVVFDIRTAATREDVNLHNVAKEMTDIRYITGERATAFKFDVDALDGETHRSNMSKELTVENVNKEMAIASKRYPNVKSRHVSPSTFVLKCKDTGKIIKPTTYSPALITDEMIGK